MRVKGSRRSIAQRTLKTCPGTTRQYLYTQRSVPDGKISSKQAPRVKRFGPKKGPRRGARTEE
jgi:hypothetical protein